MLSTTMSAEERAAGCWHTFSIAGESIVINPARYGGMPRMIRKLLL
jgi:hypothetical protein